MSAAKIGFGAVALALLWAGGDALVTTYVGREIGESCTKDSDCKGAAAWCLAGKSTGARYCSHVCSSDAACPAGWSCAASGYSQVLMVSGSPMGPGAEVDVCWREKPERHHAH
jgi:hypothetical protein